MAEDIRTRLLQNIHVLQNDYRKAQQAIEDIGDLAPFIYDLWCELGTYHPGEPPDKAIYTLAKCHTVLSKFGLLYMAIKNYEEAQAKLAEYDMRKAVSNG